MTWKKSIVPPNGQKNSPLRQKHTDPCHPPHSNHNESHLVCEIKFGGKLVAANAGKSCYVSSLCNLERIPLDTGAANLSGADNVTKKSASFSVTASEVLLGATSADDCCSL